MHRAKPSNRRLFGWILTASLGTGLPLILPTSLLADDPVEVSEARAPAAVQAAAKSYYLDSRDVVYRKSREGKQDRYIINFTTPNNIRLQIHLSETGEVAEGVRLAPTQPDRAPKRDDRERLLSEWNQRVADTRARLLTPAVVPPIPAPVPGVVPPVVKGDLPVLPAVELATPVKAADLPAAVLQSLDRFTTGTRDIRYYQVRVNDRMRYEAVYTHSDGARREVTVNNTGNLLSGPLVLQETVADSDLNQDRPDDAQPTQMATITSAEVPVKALDVMNRYTAQGTDLRYRRDTYADRSVGYAVHWVLPSNGKRYWLSTRDDGSLRVVPRLSTFQPAADNDEVRSTRIPWAQVPDRVKQTLEPLTRADREALYYQQFRDGKVFYGSEYTAGGKKMWVRTDAAGKTVVNPVLAETGRPAPAVMPREASPAAGKLPVDAIGLADLPKAVQVTVLQHTNGGKAVVTTRHTEAGRTVYHTSWLDAQNDPHQMRIDEKGQLVIEKAR